MDGKPTLCLDFDGVLHWYRNGWKGAEVIDDEPVPEAADFVEEASKYFQVTVFSSRSGYPGGIRAMLAWLERNGFPPLDLSTSKPNAFVTLDDRAVRFDGKWPDVQELLRLKTWVERGAR